MSIIWSRKELAVVIWGRRENLSNAQIADRIYRKFGSIRSPQAVSNKATELKTPKACMRTRMQPSPEDWMRIATEEARRASVRPSDVVSGSRYSKHVSARWRALKRLMDENPHASLAGIGRVVGMDHTSLRQIPERLAKREASHTPRIPLEVGKVESRTPPSFLDGAAGV